jgi:transposase
MTVVFDKGVNSDDNIRSVLESCHVVGSVPFDMVPDLLSVPLTQFKFAYRSTNGAGVIVYRETRPLWNNEEFVVIVTHNSETEKRQRKTWEKAKEIITQKLTELKEKFERSEGKGRRMSVKGLTTKIIQTIPKQYRAVYWWNIEGTSRKFEWKLIEEKETELLKKFGKNVIFTDLTKWDTKRIVKAYYSKWKIEKAFRWLHGELLIPIPPVYHSDDDRIRVHIFLCIMALTFARLIAKQLKGISVSDEQLLDDLKELKVALVKDIRTDETQLKIMEMNSVQAAVFSQLRLDKYLKVI